MQGDFTVSVVIFILASHLCTCRLACINICTQCVVVRLKSSTKRKPEGTLSVRIILELDCLCVDEIDFVQMLTVRRKNDKGEGIPVDPLQNRPNDLEHSPKKVKYSSNIQLITIATRCNQSAEEHPHIRAAPFPPAPRQPIRVHPKGVDAIKKPINGLEDESERKAEKGLEDCPFYLHRKRIAKYLAEMDSWRTWRSLGKIKSFEDILRNANYAGIPVQSIILVMFSGSFSLVAV